MKIPATGDLGLVELRNRSPLVLQLLPTGTVFALRHDGTLINQVLPGPAEDGLLRLLVRWRDETGATGWARLVGPGLGFAVAGADAAVWRTDVGSGLRCTTVFHFDQRRAAWLWRVQLQNAGPVACSVDVLHAQDLGLADEGVVRNNEAYTSQYIDFLPVRDADLGWMIFARQNLAMAGGRHPWLARTSSNHSSKKLE